MNINFRITNSGALLKSYMYMYGLQFKLGYFQFGKNAVSNANFPLAVDCSRTSLISPVSDLLKLSDYADMSIVSPRLLKFNIRVDPSVVSGNISQLGIFATVLETNNNAMLCDEQIRVGDSILYVIANFTECSINTATQTLVFCLNTAM